MFGDFGVFGVKNKILNSRVLLINNFFSLCSLILMGIFFVFSFYKEKFLKICNND